MARGLGGERGQGGATATGQGIGTGDGADPFFVPAWRTARGELTLDQPRVMGILNVTPDSFWSGSRTPTVADALRRAEAMIAAGADLLDVGGESTRPGAEPVAAETEAERIVPVVKALVKRWPELLVSVDTVKAAVAAAALAEGAAVVNDVSGLRLEPGLADVVRAHGAGLVLMHSRGGVDRMASYEQATYDDPVAETVHELAASLARSRAAGIEDGCVVLDPGLGFAKRTEHSAAVLQALPALAALGRPVLVGPSRKRFVGELAGGVAVEDRLPGTIAACVVALERGARIFRVHDVGPVRQALDVADQLHRRDP